MNLYCRNGVLKCVFYYPISMFVCCFFYILVICLYIFFLLTVGMIEHYTEYWQSFSLDQFVFVFCCVLDSLQYNFISQTAAYNV